MRDLKIQKVLYMLGGFISLAFAIYSAVLSWSIILTIRPEKEINHFELKDSASHDDYELALKMTNRLETSTSISPSNTNNHQVLGRYYEYLYRGSKTPEFEQNQAAKEKYIRLAEQSYINATLVQELNDYAWAKLAIFYDRQPQTQETLLLQALSKAIELGKYEENTQKLVIPLIFKYWHKLDNKQFKPLIIHALKHHRNARITMDSAKANRKLDELLPLLKAQWQINRVNKYKKELKQNSGVN